MGIYDRDYLQDDRRGPGFFSDAPVTKALLIANVVCFVVQLATVPAPGRPSPFDMALVNDPVAVFESGQVWRLLTSAFVHATNAPLHIVFNMVALFFLGRELERLDGPREFLRTYLLAALFSGTISALLRYYFVPESRASHGASGAISALVAIYALRFPDREVILLVFRLQMRWVLALGLGFDLVNLASQIAGRPLNNVGSSAHLGGYLFGFLVVRLGWTFAHWGLPSVPWLRGRRARPRVRVVRPEDVYGLDEDEPLPGSSGRARGAQATAGPAPRLWVDPEEEVLDARLDEVLAKIGREGRESLTPAEVEVLDAASRRARARRESRR